MSVASIMLAAIIAAPGLAAPYPRPGQPGYSVAKAFVAIVRRDEEVNVQDLSYAFGLPKLLNQGLIWNGPLGGYSEPRFAAHYDPSNSSLGITKIVIEWDDSALVHAGGKQGISRRLTVHLRPDACPSEAEMVAATGVPMNKAMFPGPDAGPSYLSQWFNIPDGKGGTRTIQYWPNRCELSASYMQ